MPKIYVMIYGEYKRSGDVVGVALAEDGETVGSHFSSSEEWLKIDLGVDGAKECHTGQSHRAEYATHYPEGFEVEFVPDPGTHPGYQAALKLNREKYPEEIA